MDTFDPKPNHANGGATKSVKTAVPGIEIAEYFPKLATRMKDVSVIRSIAGKEAAHERGTYHLHTGRRLTGAAKFPNFGSLVAHKLGDPKSDIPNFVSVGQTLSSGFLGVQAAPFVVDRPGTLPDNIAAVTDEARTRRRLQLLAAQEADFSAAGAKQLVAEHQNLYERARSLMTSPRLKAFKLDDEPAAVKERYGAKSQLGQGLLVARRLVEVGVPFVEVRRGGWDMHSRLFENIKTAGADVDTGLSALLADLKDRGMLDRTLVICMGEFGRTPKINDRPPTPGRDHWARNFSIAVAGGGLRGGQAIGSTSEDGMEIVDHEVQVEDLFQTFCKSMRIDANEELYTPEGRPLKIVDGGATISELIA